MIIMIIFINLSLKLCFTFKIIVRCHPLCKQCNGTTQSSCTDCIDNASKVNGSGSCQCNDGFYLQLIRFPTGNSLPGSCLLCNSACQTCTGPSQYDCINCSGGYTMNNNICIDTCQVGQYFDQTSQNCVYCNPSCKSCEKDLKNICNECNQFYNKNNIDNTCVYFNDQFQNCAFAENFLCGSNSENHNLCSINGWRAINANTCITCFHNVSGKCGGQYIKQLSDFCLKEGFYKFDSNSCSSCSDIISNNCGRYEIKTKCSNNGWIKKEFATCINCSDYVNGNCGGNLSERIVEACLQAGYYKYDDQKCSSCSDIVSNQCGRSEISEICKQKGWFKIDSNKCINCIYYVNGKCGGQFTQDVIDFCLNEGYYNYDNNNCSSCKEMVSNNCGRSEINARCLNDGWIKYSAQCIICTHYINGYCGGQYPQNIIDFCSLQGYINYDDNNCSTCSYNIQNNCGRIEINENCKQNGWIIFNANQCVHCVKYFNGQCGGKFSQEVIDFCLLEGYNNYDNNTCSSCKDVILNTCGRSQIATRCRTNGWMRKDYSSCIQCSKYINGQCGGQYPKHLSDFCQLEFYNFDNFNCSSCSDNILNACGRSEINVRCQQSGWITIDENYCANCKIAASGKCVQNLTQNMIDFCLKEGYFTESIIESFRDCNYQNIAVLDAILSNSIPLLTIQFGKELMIPIDFEMNKFSILLCQYIFKDQTRKLLGYDSQCAISNSIISINLEENADIVNGDFLYFKQSVLSFAQSNSIFIEMYLKNIVIQDTIIGQPKVQFKYVSVENSCSNINIKFLKISNDAKRGFKQFSWSLTSFVPSDPKLETLLQDLLSNANTEKQLDLLIPKGIIKLGIKVTIKFDYTLRLKIASFEELDLSVKSEKRILFDVQSPILNPFFKYQSGVVIIQPFIMICDPDGDIQISEPFDFSVQSIESPGINYSNPVFQQSEYIIEIQPFTLSIGKTVINIKGKLLADSLKESLIDYEIDVQSTELIVKIIGGDGYFSYKKKVIIKGTVRDNDLQSETEPQGIDILWKCIDPTTSKICIDRIGNQVILASQIQTATFEAFTFNPYTTVKLILIGKKDIREATVQIAILFSELDLPPLGIQIITLDPKTINLNEEIVVNLEYNSSVNVDLLSFSGTISYNDEVVGIIKFDYTKLRFQVWNYFNDFNRNQNSFQIRFNIYNPQYYMPSMNLITFYINFPPTNCKLSVTPNSGGFSIETKFFLQFLNCDDGDQPIYYQFFYYQSIDDFEHEKQYPLQVKRRQLCDKQKYNYVETSFPSGDILIIAQAIDSKNAIFNSTTKIIVQQKQYDENSYLQIIQLKLDQIANQQATSAISDLSIICDDMLLRMEFKSSSQLNSKKIEISNKLISLQEKLPSISLFSTVVDKAIDSLNKSGINYDQSQQSNLINSFFTQLDQFSSQQQTNIELSKEKLKQKLFDCFSVVDTLTNSGSKSQTSDKSIELIEKISQSLFRNILPNEDPVVFKGQSTDILATQITEKYICQYFLCSENKSSQSSKQTQIYNFQLIEHQNNPYSQDESFLNYTKSLKEKQPEIKISNFQVLSPKISNSLNDPIESFPKKASLAFQSKIDNIEQKNMTCLSKDKKIGWTKNGCNIVVGQTLNDYLCFCKELSPTTVIEDLVDLFENKNVDTVLSSEGIENISNFKEFYKYAAFWLLLFQSLLFIKFYFLGQRLDMFDRSTKFERVISFNVDDYFQPENVKYPKNKILPSIKVMNNSSESISNQKQDYNFFSDNILQSPMTKSTENPFYNTPLKSAFSKKIIQSPDILDLDGENTEFQKQKNQTLLNNDDKMSPQISPQISKINFDSQIAIQSPDSVKETQHRRRRQLFKNNLDQSVQLDQSKQINTDNERKTEGNNLKINQFTLDNQNQIEIQNLKSQSISSDTTKKDSEQSSQIYQTKSKDISNLPLYKRVAVFHNFFEIFFIFNPYVSRKIRFLIFYLRTVHSLAISIIFDQNYSIVQQIGLATFNSVSIIVVIKIILVSFSIRNIVGKFISLLLTTTVLLGYLYTILSVVSGQTYSQSNQFFQPFLLFYINDIFVISVFSAIIQIKIAKRILSNSKLQGLSKMFYNLLQLKLVLISMD